MRSCLPPRARGRGTVRVTTRSGARESEEEVPTGRSSHWGRAALEINQKEIQEVCEGLANKLDQPAQRTQALEVQVEQLKDTAAKNIREKEVLKKRVGFPWMDVSIDDQTKQCMACQLTSGVRAPVPVATEERYEAPWYKVNLDYGSIQKHVSQWY
ncbi:hypothetical protein NDU88_004292 [Pleurodeles waltl]|uniref:Uncharacterized protein n=1 Tax=Pleurodeles waltl TaxID=8319 RepID=A0AAV7L1I9_PLEWA|nr:hypothetical protein NDU88_004292 [Pleurodeles waltl]